MLKLYQERKSDEEMSSQVAVYPVVAEANHDMVGDAPKLTNSEAFQNLKKLSHLTPEEQSDMEKLLFELQFLGMAGYYRYFCCNFMMITAPLTKLLKKNQKHKWSSSCQAAFQQEKLMRPILMTSDFQKPFLLMVDASTSNIGAGAMLMQSDDKDIKHTICCFSCKFDSHQNYSPIERRL